MRPVSRKAAPQTAHPGPSAEREALFRRRRRHPDEPGQFAVALVVIYRTLGQLLPEYYDPDRRSLRYGQPRGTGRDRFWRVPRLFINQNLNHSSICIRTSRLCPLPWTEVLGLPDGHGP